MIAANPMTELEIKACLSIRNVITSSATYVYPYMSDDYVMVAISTVRGISSSHSTTQTSLSHNS